MDSLLTVTETLHIHTQKEKNKTPHVKVNSESRIGCKTLKLLDENIETLWDLRLGKKFLYRTP